MNCSRWEKLIALYIEGDLPEQKMRLVENHLLTCPACQDFSGTLKESQKYVRSLHNESLDEAVYQEMRNRVMNQIVPGSLIPHRGTIAGVLAELYWKPLVAGALLSLIVVFSMWRWHTQDEVSLPVSFKKVDGSLAHVIPKKDLERARRKLVDSQVIQKTAPLEAKKPKVSKSALPVPNNQTSFPSYQIVQSQSSSSEPENRKNSSPVPEPLYIELATDDPDVLIVWLIEPNRGEWK